LDACISGHAATMPPVLREQAERISGMLDQAVLEVRHVLAELRPPLLEEQGLNVALDNEVRFRTTGLVGPDILLEVADAAATLRWPGDVEYAAFMVAREAITNAELHADASLIRVLLDGDANLLSVLVIDDGKGIDAIAEAPRLSGHLGLVGMRERCAAVGARFSIEPEASGGTCVAMLWRVGEP
jgi:signal transduction histidine kinase